MGAATWAGSLWFALLLQSALGAHSMRFLHRNLFAASAISSANIGSSKSPCASRP